MRVDLVHAYVGCNRVVHAIDWGAESLVAYGAHNSVIVYDTEASSIRSKLIGHVGRVNCLRWIPTGAPGTTAKALVSGAADNCLIVWRLQLEHLEQPWNIAARLKGHDGAVTGVAVHELQSGQLLLVSTAGDDKVIVWANDAEEAGNRERLAQGSWKVRQHIPMPLQLQNAAAITSLPSLADWLLLSLGGVDNSVRLFLSPPGQPFRQVCVLRGHSNWVRSLAFTTVPAGEGSRVVLASASQDKNIRIWSIEAESSIIANSKTGNSTASISRYAPKIGFPAGETYFQASAEALLIGHEDWVHSVAWQPMGGSADRRPCLLSASMDRTMALWRPDSETGLWMSEESVGDAGPSNLGYFDGVWSPKGDAILAHGYTGALHLWRREGGAECNRSGWLPCHALGGHFDAVIDLTWTFGGTCLLSVSLDQTARICTSTPEGKWFEVARPQVHGHDFSCVASMTDSSQGSPLYASGSEEKVIRVLEAPQAFLDTLAYVQGSAPSIPTPVNLQRVEERALGAAVPALGLSNKALYTSDAPAGQEGPDLAPRAEPGVIRGRPLEEHLQQSTLWPEIYKIYGHGNDLYCLAADPRGLFLASACKAQSKEFAAIWIWTVGDWEAVQKLEAHTLTATQLAFAPDGSHLVSVSRDRSLALWRRTDVCQLSADDSAPFKLVGKLNKAHGRVIWSVSCSHDGSYFATGSRDNTIKIWQIPECGREMPQKPILTLPAFHSSVQAVSFAPRAHSSASSHLLAVGFEDGGLKILSLGMGEAGNSHVSQWDVVWNAPAYQAHCGAVRQLCWQHHRNAGGAVSDLQEPLLLASASEDHAVHVFKLYL